MLELGELHDAGHRAVGEAAAGVCEELVVVGGRPGAGAAAIVEGARDAGLDSTGIHAVADRETALEVLDGMLRPGDVVLVKASRGVELDLLVEALVMARAGEGGGQPRDPAEGAR
jgi:UDP-N-acetylmuramoyl-tripeptide--D-alanyl-D-alanine ligase